MEKKTSLTEAEWKIMQILWDSAPITVMQLVKHFKGNTDWSKHAIISLLKRMQAKGTVIMEDNGRTKFFYPAIMKDEVYKAETKSFLSKLYDGKIGLMITEMVRNDYLKHDEITELMDFLNKSLGDEHND